MGRHLCYDGGVRTPFLLLVAGLLSGCADDAADPATYAGPTALVQILQGSLNRGTEAFGANPLTVATGTRVVWVSRDPSVTHVIASDSASFTSGALGDGDMFHVDFATAGTYGYHCAIHGAALESGTVIAQ
jgi:plastocyanin